MAKKQNPYQDVYGDISNMLQGGTGVTSRELLEGGGKVNEQSPRVSILSGDGPNIRAGR